MQEHKFQFVTDQLRGHRLTRDQAEHLVSIVVNPMIAGSGLQIELRETGKQITPPVQTKQQIMDAIARLVLETLAKGDNPDMGFVFQTPNLEVGNTPMGSWQVTVERKARPQ